MKDYYKVLGVAETATQDEIKSAFKKMAIQHHPDKGGDEEKFKEIGEAYDTLKDANKKSEYDSIRQFGGNNSFRQGGRNFSFDSDNLNDIFGMHFNNIFRKSPDTVVNFNIELEDAFTGKRQKINIPHLHNSFEIDIPAGVYSGTNYIIKGGGQKRNPNMDPGNLIINLIVLPHPIYTRVKDHLEMSLDIDVVDCILGTTKNIRSVDGKELKITIPPGTQQDKRFKLPGYGMKNPQNNSVRGDLFVRVNIVVPTNITKKQQELLENFKKESK